MIFKTELIIEDWIHKLFRVSKILVCINFNLQVAPGLITLVILSLYMMPGVEWIPQYVLLFQSFQTPPPQTFDFTWDGPVPVSVRTTISRTDVSYKHVVESVIPVKDEKYFGNYTLVYNEEIFTKITINAKGNLFQLYFCIVYIKRNLLRSLV